MNVRLANNEDINIILKLLSEVLEIHASIRPDIFISGTTKYTKEDLQGILQDRNKFIYVYEKDSQVLGYIFCEVLEPLNKPNMKRPKALFIDDLCVDSNVRGQHIGEALFMYAKEKAKELGCKEILLSAWEGNVPALTFYKKMGLKVRNYTLESKI